MCLLAFQLAHHPHYKLVLIANRDEEYERPTAPAAFWQDDPTILAGRDLAQHGTWLGINKRGRIAALTNYRDFSLPVTGPKSRGHIVTSFLQSEDTPQAFVEALHDQQADYTGFNLLAGTSDDFWYYSNIERLHYKLPTGIHGLSNAFLNTPWPKVTRTKELLADYMKRVDCVDRDVLFAMMQRAETFPAAQLPDTGAGPALESILSSIFIASEGYGTRCTTVLTIDREDFVQFEERTYTEGLFTSAVQYSFTIEP